jgi:hypothetical protein
LEPPFPPFQAGRLRNSGAVESLRESAMVRSLIATPTGRQLTVSESFFGRKMMSERDNESFDLDEEFLAEAEDNTVYDQMLDKVERRARPNPGAPKRGKAAWSRLEEVLADRRLEKDLQESFDDEE